ncbi:zf-HC2 domain-containing protein [uncultured Marinobacter sp.]|uniref:zf-HC2 domain-containing protein n=1 Tax=uncultured Marinobacter sp. TaxID=187379 RepID=UPI0030D84E16
MISCRQAREYIDQYANGAIAAADALTLERHIAGCHLCARRLSLQQQIAGEIVRQARIPEPTPDFESRVLAAATSRDNTGGRRWAIPALGGAVAAALVLGLALAPRSHLKPELAPVREETTRAASPVEPREQTVRLAFTSSSQLDNVSLTLELPPHVELTPFPGRHQLTWQVNLKPGDNVIALPLRIAYPEGGEIVARLDDGSNTRTFRASIPATGSDRSKEPSS